MIRSVIVANAHDEYLEMPLNRPDKSGIGIQSITGIGSPMMNVITSNRYNDGSRLEHIRAEQRNIVLTFFPMPYPDVETSRQILYKYFPLYSMITLMFNLDNRKVSISGYVESIEPNIFENPETVSISVICPQPFFESHVPTVLNFWESVPLFEFPFSNESFTEPLLEFGESSPKTSINIDYSGDVPGGMRLTMRGTGQMCDAIHIYNLSSNEHMIIDRSLANQVLVPQGISPGSLAASGIVITLDTTPGSQFLTLYYESTGKTYNMLPALGREIDWAQLYPGKQEIVVKALPNSGQNVEIVRSSIEYKTRYAGI